MIILPRLFRFIEKKNDEEQEVSDSAGSSEDDMPLSKYPQEKPTGREKGPNTETHILAQYVEQRDAKIKNQSMAGKTKGGFQSARKVVGVPTDKGDNQTEHDKEKAGLLEQLQAEKKKREVLRAEKTILETKHNTVQKMLETERRKTHSLENEKRELEEALQVANSKHETLQGLHEKV